MTVQTTTDKDKLTIQNIASERIKEAERDIQRQMYKVEQEKIKLKSMRVALKLLKVEAK